MLQAWRSQVAAARTLAATNPRGAAAAALALLLAFVLMCRLWIGLVPALLVSKDTLIIYVYAPGDPEYLNNLRYFVQQGIPDADPKRDYVLLVQVCGDFCVH